MPRKNPTNVMPNSSAKSMAKRDGAPTAAIILIPAVADFCTNSKEILPLSINIFSDSGTLAICCPINFSKALRRPASSFKSMSCPLNVTSA